MNELSNARVAINSRSNLRGERQRYGETEREREGNEKVRDRKKDDTKKEEETFSPWILVMNPQSLLKADNRAKVKATSSLITSIHHKCNIGRPIVLLLLLLLLRRSLSLSLTHLSRSCIERNRRVLREGERKRAA